MPKHNNCINCWNTPDDLHLGFPDKWFVEDEIRGARSQTVWLWNWRQIHRTSRQVHALCVNVASHLLLWITPVTFPQAGLHTNHLQYAACAVFNIKTVSSVYTVSPPKRTHDIPSLYQVMDQHAHRGHLFNMTLHLALFSFLFFLPLFFLSLAVRTNHSPKLHSMVPLWMMTRQREDLALRTALIMEKTHRAMH